MKQVFQHADEKMHKSISALSREFASIRAGRANPAVLDRITVDYYGAPTPINQLAAVSVSEARVLLIQPWDVSVCRLIEKAIQASDLGVNPQSDGKVIRLIFPQLTEERRRDLAKETGKMAEECKISVRAVRRDAIEKLKTMKKDGEIGEDDMKFGEKKVQDITDACCKEIDDVLAEKEKEIMEI